MAEKPTELPKITVTPAEPIIVDAPDGKTQVEFPPDATKEQIRQAMEKKWPSFKPATARTSGQPFQSDDPRDWDLYQRQAATPVNPDHKFSLLNMAQDVYEAVKRAMWTPQNVQPQDILTLGSTGTPSPGMQTSRQAYARGAEAIGEEMAASEGRALLRGEEYILGKASARPRFETERGRGVRAERSDIESAAARIGVTELPRAATGGTTEQMTAGALSSTHAGLPLQEQSRKAYDQIVAAKEQVANALGTAADRAAGEGAGGEVQHWIEEGSKAEATRIYAPLDTAVEAIERSPARRKGGPALAQAIANGLPQHTYVRPMPEFTKAWNAIAQEMARIGQQQPGWFADMEAHTLPTSQYQYRDMQRVRSILGDMKSGKLSGIVGLDEVLVDRLYAGASADLRAFGVDALSRARGGMSQRDAGVLWDSIQNSYRVTIRQKREQLAKLVGVKGDASGETVVDRILQYAGGGKGADASRLRQIRSVIGNDTWDQVAGSIIREMGFDKAENKLSMAKFARAWRGLSDEGRELLVRDPAHRQALTDIATVGKAADRLYKWGNPSGTGRTILLGSAIGVALWHPFVALGTALGNFSMAWMLSQPRGANALARWGEAYLQARVRNTPENVAAAKNAFQMVVNEAAINVPDPETAKYLGRGVIIRTPDGEIRRTK